MPIQPEPFRDGLTGHPVKRLPVNTSIDAQIQAMRGVSTQAKIGSFRDPVAMAWRLTGDNHSNRTCAFIQCLMLLPRGNLETVADLKNDPMIFDLQSEFAFEDKEELACMHM